MNATLNKPDTLTIQHMIDTINDDGWLDSSARERYVEAATELIDEDWPIERVASFLSGLFVAAIAEAS